MFSYVVLRKAGPHEAPFYRLMSTPLKRDKHVIVDMCCPGGTYERRVYTKGKMKELPTKYREIRKAEWGGELSLYTI